MIDIHSHLVFDVDDGSKSLEQSIEYLKEIKEMNLNKVVCTPHMKKGNKDRALKIINNFKIIRDEAKKMGIKLYLGNEIMYTSDTIKLLKSKKITTLNNSKYILLEFKRHEKMSVDNLLNILEDILESGYKIVLAHPEEYINYRTLEDAKKIKELGILLQIDANNVLLSKSSSLRAYMFTKKLLKNHLCDIVASDAHCTKKRNFLALKQAYSKITRKYGSEYADIMFCNNPKIIIKN